MGSTPNTSIDASLRFLQWNAGSINNKRDELSRMIQEHKPALVALIETHLQPKHDFRQPGFVTLRQDRAARGGGVALLIRQDLPFLQAKLPSLTLEAIAATIYVGRKKLFVASFYDPSGDCPMDDYEVLMDPTNPSILLMGDANAHHADWGSSTADAQGRRLVDLLIERTALCLLNTGAPTFYRHGSGSPSHLDLTFCSADLALDAGWETLLIGSSDHVPISGSLQLAHPIVQQTRRLWALKRANWALFSATAAKMSTEAPPASCLPIPEAAHIMTKIIISSAHSSIPLLEIHPGARVQQAWWSAACQRAVNQKRKARQRASSSQTPDAQIAFRAAVAHARRTIRQARRTHWQAYCQTLTSDTPLTKVWRMAKHQTSAPPSSIPALKRPDGSVASSASDRGETLLKTFFQPDMLTPVRAAALKALPNGPATPFADVINCPFTREELSAAIASLTSSAPGPDEVHNLMLKHLPPHAQERLLALYNASWSAGLVPPEWKTARIIPLPKPGKPPNDPKSYRPIALTSCLLKLQERLVNSRLVWTLETNDLLSNHQYGFRRGRSTLDPLLALCEDAHRAIATKKYLAVALLDVERAFDRIPHISIITKLRTLGFHGSLIAWTADYLAKRTYSLDVGGHTSLATSSCGVPQGGVLSPTLYMIVMDKMADGPSNLAKTCLFADDIGSRSSAKHLYDATSALQVSLNYIADYGDTWGLPINPKKSAIIVFNGGFVDPAQVKLSIHGEAIPVVSSIRHLGVILDQKMTWKDHLTSLASSCVRRLSLLRAISHFQGSADRHSLTRVYTALIRSRLDYAAPLFVRAAQSHLFLLDKVQNQAMRIISGLPRSTSTAAMEVELHLSPLTFRRDEALLRHMARHLSAGLALPTRSRNEKNYKPRKHHAQHSTSTAILLSNLDLSDATSLLETRTLYPATPPWASSQVLPGNTQVLTDWLHEPKTNYDPLTTRSLFMIELSRLPHHDLVIYTDASKDPSTDSCAVGIFSPTTGQKQSRRLRPELSITSAETHAILLALQLAATTSANSVLIASDSMGALEQIASPSHTGETLCAIRQIAGSFSHTTLLWTPAHVGIPGNETADSLAAQGHHEPDIFPSRIPLQDFLRAVRTASLKSWSTLWNSCPTGRALHRIKPTPKPWPHVGRSPAITDRALAALRCGRARLPATLATYDPSLSPDCPTCGVVSDAAHLLLKCSLFSSERATLASKMTQIGQPLSLINALGGGTASPAAQRKITQAVVDFLSDTVTLQKLLRG